MKQRCAAIALCLAMLMTLLGCGNGKSNVTAVGTTFAGDPPAAIGTVISRPPTRSANTQYGFDPLRDSLTLLELWESAEAVAWVSIGNWLSENDFGSYYDATVLECYKGELPSSIVLEQAGSSVNTYTDFPLLTYGNECLVFLQCWDAEAISMSGPVIPENPPYMKPTTPVPDVDDTEPVAEEPDWIIDDDEILDPPALILPVQTTSPDGSDDLPEPEPEPEVKPPYEHCYQLLSGSAMMDAAVGMDGQVYLLDRYYLVDPYLGFHAYNRPAAEIEEDVRQLLERRDAYSYRLFTSRFLYRLTDLVDYLQNPTPETVEE
ncbi:MAG: hypothetical protein IJW62_06135 [Clostridia bacterium]|nr:hypothetical protein [Clostridia bacterium]